jgi:3-deoxy-D-arabino-heptulosonate 7-phosphate (DAHP) synthase
MIIAGPCSYIDLSDDGEILDTAVELKGVADWYRVKPYLGGTRPDRFMKGMEYSAHLMLKHINSTIMPVGIEVQTAAQLVEMHTAISYAWIGARNSANYGLLEELRFYKGPLLIKRGPAMTVDETIGLYDILRDIYKFEPMIIERGIVTIDRTDTSRWSPDLKGVIRIKNERPDIFRKLVIDCSHSVGVANYVADTYRAFKAIGCQHFMFECTASGKSRTDQGQMISVKQLKEILC